MVVWKFKTWEIITNPEILHFIKSHPTTCIWLAIASVTTGAIFISAIIHAVNHSKPRRKYTYAKYGQVKYLENIKDVR